MGNTWPTLDSERLHMTDIGVNDNRSWNNSREEPNDKKEISRNNR
jgi:hypothetical protein